LQKKKLRQEKTLWEDVIFRQFGSGVDEVLEEWDESMMTRM
jgi:hypothetical protein